MGSRWMSAWTRGRSCNMPSWPGTAGREAHGVQITRQGPWRMGSAPGQRGRISRWRTPSLDGGWFVVADG